VKNPATGLQATVHRQGYVAGQPNTFLTYPAVGVNAAGKVEMVFTVAGVGEFPSAAVWPLGGEAIHIVSEGAAPQDGFSAYLFGRPRWGDYSAVAADRDGSIWMATEFIPGPRDFFTNWGTFVARASADRGQRRRLRTLSVRNAARAARSSGAKPTRPEGRRGRRW